MKISSQKIPFEIHLTTENLSVAEAVRFKKLCVETDGKPLIIELSRGNIINQPMFSKRILLENAAESVRVAKNLAGNFYSKNFPIKRIKIETPAEFADLIDENSFANKYFEWHGKINIEKVKKFDELCELHKIHLSTNSIKEEKSLRFLTLREYGAKEIFQNRINSLTDDLEKNGVDILKQEFEFCFYDDNDFLDEGWLPK